jgi:CBS-domain-containing membrane protein
LQWFAEALVTSMIIFSIAYLGFIHPPSAACGLIYIRGDQAIKDMFWLYLIVPSLVGCGILITMGVILNNLKKDRRYPLYW